MKNISTYITYEEAIFSPTALKKGIKNVPNSKEVERMLYVGILFDKVRENFGVPIKINSFFRCKQLNDIIGSNDRSFHRIGSAIDCKAIQGTGITNADIYNYILNNCDFTELIWEYGTDEDPAWVHFAIMKGREKEKKVKRIGK